MKVTELENGQRYLVEYEKPHHPKKPNRFYSDKAFDNDSLFFRGMKWVMLGKSKDTARPILTNIQIKDRKVITADGFRIHVMDFSNHKFNADPSVILPEGVFGVKAAGNSAFILTQFETGLKFPDCEKLISDVYSMHKDPKLIEKPILGVFGGVFKIAFNPVFLEELGELRKLDIHAPVRCLFCGDNKPALFEYQTDTLKFTAMIMPMHL